MASSPSREMCIRDRYLRVMPEFTVSGYANRRQRLCCGVGEDPALRVRRQETEDVYKRQVFPRRCGCWWAKGEQVFSNG